MAQLTPGAYGGYSNPLAALYSQNLFNQNGSYTPSSFSPMQNSLTPGIMAARQIGGHSQTGLGPVAGVIGSVGGSMAAGAALGSVVPGIGTVIGAIVGALASSMMKTNASPIQDIYNAQRLGRPISPQSWNLAGFGPGGTYLPPQMLLTKAPGQSNNAPLRDIAQGIAGGATISDASWAKAGLPPGGGAYGALMQQTLGKAKALTTANPLMPQGGNSNG